MTSADTTMEKPVDVISDWELFDASHDTFTVYRNINIGDSKILSWNTFRVYCNFCNARGHMSEDWRAYGFGLSHYENRHRTVNGMPSLSIKIKLTAPALAAFEVYQALNDKVKAIIP